MTRTTWGLIAVLVLLAPLAASAAWIDPNLQERLDSARPGEKIDAYVVLARQADLDRAVAAARGQGFAARHRLVITALREVAADAQRAIRADLAAARSAGTVTRIRPFWITDAVAVTATADVLRGIAARSDVASVYLDAPIELIEPVRKGEPLSSADAKGIENGITVTRAPELWDMGIDGTGRIACNQDTGVDGTHEALTDRWRGNDGGVDPEDAWFDPNGVSPDFPVDYYGHGTHTMGTMVGDDGGTHQIGMAPGAKWIAARTVDVGDIFSDAVAGFEWAADPDGDAGTIDDVPDVVSNSWGLPAWWYGSCQDDFNASIDACEAAGVPVVFAAGNEGPGAETLRSPGDRIASTLNTFSVGAINQDATTAAYFTSMGPSACDHSTIKPEVAAVGVSVLSATPGDDYAAWDGTSMATPHVGGAIVLLRQAFPNTSPEMLKSALYLSAVDLGTSGEDNTFGRGRIDVVAAYDWLDANMLTCYADADGDGYGDAGTIGRYEDACPAGWTDDGTDCDDSDAAVNPGAAEVCNGLDDNCVSGADEGGDALCDDAAYCTGVETCAGVSGCVAGEDPCPDDALFCTGTESCDEDADVCVASGDPCGAGESCDEETDACVPASDDDSSDDDSSDDDTGADDDDGGCGC
jgi:subtilisin family serine protease